MMIYPNKHSKRSTLFIFPKVVSKETMSPKWEYTTIVFESVQKILAIKPFVSIYKA